MQFKLRPVLQPKELLDAAFSLGRQHPPTANKKMRSNKRFAKELEKYKLETTGNELTERLEKTVKQFPVFDELPAFYQELCAASFDLDATRRRLGHIQAKAKLVQKLKREHLGKIFKSKTASEIKKWSKAYYGRISSMIKKLGPDLRELQNARKKILELPNVSTDLFTIVLAGSPNVGKTSILSALTGSTPQIAPYPFTTQGLKIGHVKHRYWTIQLVDTPGLLDRPFEKRNPIEKKAVLALAYLATAIVFVVDPSFTSGFSLEQQKKLLDEIKREFEKKPIVVVFSKTDVATFEQLKQAKDLFGEGLTINHHNVQALHDKIAEWAVRQSP